MIRRSGIHIITIATLALGGCTTESARRDSGVVAETKAVEFLKREVPAWSRDNGCFSCHNNGDAARALYAAARKGYRVPPGVLVDTTDWVSHPERWEHNKGDPGFSDQRLADVQFAATLAAALESRLVNDDQAMKAAALKVAQTQSEDGSWPIDVANPAGSPTTHGVALATYMAWDTLRHSPRLETSAAAAHAAVWLKSLKPDSVPNAAAQLLFLARNRKDPSLVLTNTLASSDGERDGMRGSVKQSLAFLRRAQRSDGGWGPYADSPPEAFDTALALLALAEFPAETGVPGIIQSGRWFLTTTQLPDGSWPATTRPSGGQSYAQQMSTTGWATLALLATR